MLVHPVDPYPGVRETLEALKPHVQAARRHARRSVRPGAQARGVRPDQYFDEVEIVSDKTALVYDRIFTRHGDGPQRAMMIGNSMRADVVPAIEAGAWGIHVPSEHVWSMDLARRSQGRRGSAACPMSRPCVELIAEIG